MHDNENAAQHPECDGSGMIGGAGASTLSQDCTNPAGPSLTERLQYQRRRAREQARNASNLDELIYLLDKNPEVARILELLKQVGE